MRTLLALLTLALLAGCASGPPMQPNHEHHGCMRQCQRQKNDCVLNSFNNQALSQCDQAMSQCLTPCAQIPAYIPMEQP